MTRRSAGVVLYRMAPHGLEVLLAHPGGPFWMKKDEGAWSIPKGEYGLDEDARMAARREFHEETGSMLSGELMGLGDFKQPSGKIVTAFAAKGDFNPADLRSNICQIEWPPRSGQVIDIPEVDKVAWFDIEEAQKRIAKGQQPIIDAFVKAIAECDE